LKSIQGADVGEPLGNAGTPEERRTGIGGSEAAAALGLSPWQSPFDLWEQKRGLAPPVEQNEPMLWGQLLEDTIRREYARRTGYDVRPVKEMIRHPEHPWMFAHIDGEIGPLRNMILEVKTTRDSRGWGEPGTDEIPQHYLVQTHHYMACTTAEVCHVAVLIGGQDFRLYQVDRDAEIQQRVIEGEAEFWEWVKQGVPPPPSTLEDAMRRWGRFDARGYKVAGPEEIDAVAVLRAAHQQKAVLEELEERAKLVVMSAMGETGQSLVHPDGELLVTWKLDNGRKGYSVAPREPSRRLLVKYLEEAA
jgi:putative phage-type endonuclease